MTQVTVQIKAKGLLTNQKIIRTLSDSQINRLAKILPSVEVLTHEVHYVIGRELIAQGHTEQDGKPIIEDYMYEQNMPVILEVSHKRAMKKLYRKYGDAGVMLYYNEVTNKANETATSKN